MTSTTITKFSVPRIRIAIDPGLLELHSPEIHWVFRTLLTGIGWSWQEVPIDFQCDLAYVRDPSSAPSARLCIQARQDGWESPSANRLARLERIGELVHLVFEGEIPHPDVLERANGRIVCHRDLIFDFFWLVTGQEECHWPIDRHGFADLSGTPYLEQKTLVQAVASQIGLWLDISLKEQGCPPPVPRWPGGKQLAVGVGHDVDYPEVKRLIEPLRIMKRLGSQGILPTIEVLTGRRHHWQFSAWVELEKTLNARSSFYFVARQGSLWEYATGVPDPFYDITSSRFRKLFHYLTQAGCEIALQASYLAYQNKEKFAAEKQCLEEACGQPVMGNHHHYWHLDPNDVESTLLIHEQVGFLYDSSLNHDRYLGWRRGFSWPFFPYHQTLRRQLKTLQLPIAWMDDQLFTFQNKNNNSDRQERLRELVACAARQQGVFLVDIHDYVYDPVLFPEWAQTFHDLWLYIMTNLECWFATSAEITQYWIKRYDALINASSGLDQGI